MSLCLSIINDLSTMDIISGSRRAPGESDYYDFTDL